MKRGAIIGLAAGAVVLLVVWYFLLFAPTSNDLSDTREKVSAAQHQTQELENTVRRLKELSRNAPQQEADLRALRAAIPPTPDLGEFILQANEIASASGIDWLSISPAPPVANTGSANSSIALAIQIDGGFFQLLDYLNRLEDLDRLVILDAVSVSTGGADTGATGSTGGTGSSSSSSSGGAPTLSITLTGRMFTQAEAAATDGSTGGSTATPTTPPATSPSANGSS